MTEPLHHHERHQPHPPARCTPPRPPHTNASPPPGPTSGRHTDRGTLVLKVEGIAITVDLAQTESLIPVTTSPGSPSSTGNG